MVSTNALARSAVCAAVMLAVSHVAYAQVTDLGAFPNPFSPNGDGTYDEVQISYVLTQSDWVEVYIEDSSDIVVRDFTQGEVEQEAGPHQYTWDGLDDNQDELPDGNYTVFVDAGGPPHELVLVLDKTPPVLEALVISPSRFTPDGDGVADSTLIEFMIESPSATDRFWVEVLDPTGEPLVELLTGTGVESVDVYWSGLDGEGEAAPDTVYGVVVRAVDAAGNEDSSETLVDLDLNPPLLAAVYAPDPEIPEIRVAASQETIVIGTAYDRAGVDDVLASLDGGDTWTSVMSGADSREGALVSWSGLFECEECVDGTRDDTTSVIIRAHDATLTSDGLGHYNTEETANPWLSFDVVFDLARAVHDTTYAEDPDATYEGGQMIIIDTVWDSPGYTIEPDFSRFDSAVAAPFDTSDVEVEPKEAGRYRIKYTLSTSNSKAPVYGRRLRIRATDGFGRATVDSTLVLTVLESTGEVPGLSVDANSFDPTASESVKIELGEAGRGATVDIYNVAGTLVRSLEAGQATAVSWNGRNDSGEIVASGVYFLQIRTGAGDATRTVAVVK